MKALERTLEGERVTSRPSEGSAVAVRARATGERRPSNASRAAACAGGSGASGALERALLVEAGW